MLRKGLTRKCGQRSDEGKIIKSWIHIRGEKSLEIPRRRKACRGSLAIKPSWKKGERVGSRWMTGRKCEKIWGRMGSRSIAMKITGEVT